ncbi:integrase core domain-containing protein [Arthrobacter sp. MDT2-16]
MPSNRVWRRIRPATPRLNGKVERSHRIDSEEFYRLLEGQVINDVNLFQDRPQQREDHYNYDRPHGALAGSTPYERLRQKTLDPLS